MRHYKIDDRAAVVFINLKLNITNRVFPNPNRKTVLRRIEHDPIKTGVEFCKREPPVLISLCFGDYDALDRGVEDQAFRLTLTLWKYFNLTYSFGLERLANPAFQ